MSDSVGKGVGEQLGQLGKQIAVDVATLPGKLTGLDKGTSETAGQGTGSKQQGKTAKQSQQKAGDAITFLKQKDEAEKQKQLAQARRLLQLIMQPQQNEMTLQEQLEQEELEKKRKEIEEEKKKALKSLPQMASKRPRGDLYGTRAKQFGGELGKNVKAQ